ncbi:MAG TPA: PIN domain-containing protein [Planctomycetota bacterium]|nr:PIN domain-containing protein [Planctomycetota bacterium]
MKVFLDTNVLVDVLTRREPFYADSARVWTLAEMGQIEGAISALSFPNVSYVVKRLKGKEAERECLRALRALFEPAALDAQIVNQALDSRLADFEDALQWFSALRYGAECLVTRNAAHFPSEDIRVMTPAEFLAAHFLDDTPT